jgi:hypothetical protein
MIRLHLNSPFFQITWMNNIVWNKYGNNTRRFSAVAVVTLRAFGLFAIGALYFQAKIKEAGIRKVQGASIPQLVLVLIENFYLHGALSHRVGCSISLVHNEQLAGEIYTQDSH